MATAPVPPLGPATPSGGDGGDIDGAAPKLGTGAQAVLEALAREGSLTIEALRVATGLSRQTIRKSILHLEARGYVSRESDPAITNREKPAGRPPARVMLARDAGYVVAVDIGHQSVRYAVAGPGGDIEGTVRDAPIRRGAGGLGALDFVSRQVSELLQQSGVAPASVRGVGLAVPAPVDDGAAAPSLSVHSPWRGVRLAEAMRRAIVRQLGAAIPVVAGNDANFAVLGELRAGVAVGYADRTVLLVKVSAGVGAGILINGDLVTGLAGGAGEIGHTAVVDRDLLAYPPGTKPDLHLPVCARCRRIGCLQSVASANAVVEALRREHPTLYDSTKLPSEVIRDALARPEEHPRCTEAIQRAGHFLGASIGTIVNVLDVDLVVISGVLSRAGPVLLDPIREEVAARELRAGENRTRVVVGMPEHAAIHGAIAAVLRDVRPRFAQEPERVPLQTVL